MTLLVLLTAQRFPQSEGRKLLTKGNSLLDAQKALCCLSAGSVQTQQGPCFSHECPHVCELHWIFQSQVAGDAGIVVL